MVMTACCVQKFGNRVSERCNILFPPSVWFNIMNQNCYPGREYLSNLKNLDIDVLSIGQYPEIDRDEEERCGNLWKPESEQTLSEYFNFSRIPAKTTIAIAQPTPAPSP